MKQVRLQPEAFELKSPLLNTGCIVSTICPHSFYVDPGEALHHQAVEGCKNWFEREQLLQSLIFLLEYITTTIVIGVAARKSAPAMLCPRIATIYSSFR
jgi:hypothetical protein